MERHIYHFKLSWWIVLLSISIFTMGWSLYGILEFLKVVRLSALILSIGYIVSILVFFLFFALGFLFFLMLFTTRIVLSPEGLEYHTLGKHVRAAWTGVRIEMPKEQWETVRVIHLIDPQVTIKSWTRYVPWRVKKEATDQIIQISQFGGLLPRKVIEDIQRFAPYLGMR